MQGARTAAARQIDTEPDARFRLLGWTALPLLALCAVLFGTALLTPATRPFAPLLVLLLVPAAEFALTPLWRRAGVYRYYSPFLFLLQRGQGRYELHGGTAFDYLWHLRWAERGHRARRRVLYHYLEGLLAVIDDVARGRIPGSAELVATSYLFSERTARQLGFTVQRASLVERLHFLLDILSLTALYSYTRGRATLPGIGRVRCASIRAAALTEQEPTIRRRLLRMSARACAPE